MAHWRQKGGTKRDKTDILFSELVRERANWICEYCNKDFKHDKGRLHCSHFFGRRKRGTRWHPDAVAAHCGDCHGYLGENPIDFAEWIKQTFGEEHYDRVRLLGNKTTRITSADKEHLHKHYLQERRRLKALRESGETGRLEFDYGL